MCRGWHVVAVALCLMLRSGEVAAVESNAVFYEIVSRNEVAEVRRYPAGVWLSVLVPNDNYAVMIAYGYAMLEDFFESEDDSDGSALVMKMPMRVSMDVWDMDAPRFASVFLGEKFQGRRMPKPPLFLSEEPEAFVYSKRVRCTDDLRIVLHHAACLLADLSMRRASVNIRKIFVSFYSPDYRYDSQTNVDSMDEVWVQWVDSS